MPPTSKSATVSPHPPKRITSLDGLRGCLAIIVVFFHLWLIDIFAASITGFDTSVLDLTPANILLKGGWQAVIGFFVLSGFALTVPIIKATKKFDWLAYYPSRLIRLYLPVICSIILSILFAYLVQGDVNAPGNEWLKTGSVYAAKMGEYHILNALSLNSLGGGSGLNLALWSLYWEIMFSLLLPVLIKLVGGLYRKVNYLPSTVILILIATLGAATNTDWLYFIPCFGLGMLIAYKYFTEPKPGKTTPKTKTVSLLPILGITLLWLSILPSTLPSIPGLFKVYALLAGLALVWGALSTPYFTKFLSSKPVVWLGKISFSVYLTHVPIIIACTYLIPRNLWVVHILVSLAAVLLFATVFQRWVERPIHHLARKTNKSITSLRTQNTTQTATGNLPKILNKKLF